MTFENNKQDQTTETINIDKPFSPEKIIADFFAKRYPRQSIAELFRINIWETYTGTTAQQKRLISYLLIKQNKWTIDWYIINNLWKKSDYNTKKVLFDKFTKDWLMDSKKAGSLIYRWTMEQNLELLHLLVQESFFGNIERELALKETKDDIRDLKFELDTSTDTKQSLWFNKVKYWETTQSKTLDKTAPAKTFEEKNPKFDINIADLANPQIRKMEDEIIDDNLVVWSIDPKKMRAKMYDKEWMYWKCSKLARLYLQSLWITRDRIIVGNSVDIIRDLRKNHTWTEYRADELRDELVRRAKEWKGNVYDSYFLTALWHRVILFVWNDAELYVIDPYYAGKKPVKIMDYSLSKSPKWVRIVLVPDWEWYLIIK